MQKIPVEAIIMLAPHDVLRDASFQSVSDLVDLVKANLNRYKKHTVVLDAKFHGDWEGAAEECFDLTNNPWRQEEREQAYGRHRSVSVGDVIDLGNNATDGGQWVCASVGWVQIGRGA